MQREAERNSQIAWPGTKLLVAGTKKRDISLEDPAPEKWLQTLPETGPPASELVQFRAVEGAYDRRVTDQVCGLDY